VWPRHSNNCPRSCAWQVVWICLTFLPVDFKIPGEMTELLSEHNHQCTIKDCDFDLKVWPWPSSNRPGSCEPHVIFMCTTFQPGYFKISQEMTELLSRHDHQCIIRHYNFDLSLTLTFKQPTCVLFMIHCLYVFDISAKLFENPLRNDRDTEWTRPPVQYQGLWLLPLSVTLTFEQ
jgi:hypothetical protein